MRSPFLAFCLLLVIGGTTFVSAITRGYNCDNEFFSNGELQEIADQAMNQPRLEDPTLRSLKRISKWYNGPPFTKPYLLWPIAHKTGFYKGAAPTTYRVVLDENFEVFSVVMKYGNNIKECQMKEEFRDGGKTCNYECEEKLFKNIELRRAAKVACPQLRDGSLTRFPARYDGPYRGSPFNTYGRQLYIFPLLESGVYKPGNGMEEPPSSFGRQQNSPYDLLTSITDPGSVYLLLNSKCQIESVLRKTESSSYEKCRDISSLSANRVDKNSVPRRIHNR